MEFWQLAALTILGGVVAIVSIVAVMILATAIAMAKAQINDDLDYYDD